MTAAAIGCIFAAFVTAKGIPTLRHDWNWPIDRSAIGSFWNDSIGGWVASGFGAANPHPTPYLLAVPVTAAMWVFGPLLALALLAFFTGYVCARAAAALSQRLGCGPLAALGIALFAAFNPWVYTEVVAGHLTMVLAYGAFIGLAAEMLLGAQASPVRLALWLALTESQLQFFLLALLALAVFAACTRKWLPLGVGAVLALPSVVGVAAERATLLATPYTVTWQANQSVDPVALLALSGYFTGYSDRLGIAASAAVWVVLALGLFGLTVAMRSNVAVRWAAFAAIVLYVAIGGVHGLAAVPYEWVVRRIPESGVFRELYDLAGLFAVTIALLACAGMARYARFAYVGTCAGLVLLGTWTLQPPGGEWIGAPAYPHPSVSGSPFSRVALLPAFQPMGLRAGGGSGADPDAFVRPGHVATINEYLPRYPVDMALARYVRNGDASALRGLGVGAIVNRPWLLSQSNGTIGLAARSLAVSARPRAGWGSRPIEDATPLISACQTPRVGALADRLGDCNLFFGDLAEAGARTPSAWRGYAAVRPIAAQNDSLDPRTAWIDARLAFAEVPALAQAIGGAVTQSRLPHAVDSGASMLVYVRGRLSDSRGRSLVTSPGAFRWLNVPRGVDRVTCAGLCELVAVGRPPARLSMNPPASPAWALPLRAPAPWLFVVQTGSKPARLLRLNERYDAGWVAIGAGHILPHVRVDMAANGWLYPSRPPRSVVLLQATALLQLLAEIVGIACVIWLLKALLRVPPKRAR